MGRLNACSTKWAVSAVAGDPSGYLALNGKTVDIGKCLVVCVLPELKYSIRQH